MPNAKESVKFAQAEETGRPSLRSVQTEGFNHASTPSDDLSVDEQAAVLEAMSLESPPGLVQSPNSYSTEFSPKSAGTYSGGISPITPTTPISPTPSKFMTALQDVRHFAGGLIAHPYESTKHYSILRHSSGLVYYSGPTTNLAITIFSDRELPPDRTLWLQRKGFYGKTGLKIGSLLGARSTWINVTPTVRANPDQLDPTNERAWQRDIKKFLKKAPKEIRSHRVRETDILRIPCDADDGYLRVVLCTAEGKKVLCGSPVFRLASSTTNFSTIRGASLSTMPLEVGAKIGQIVARNAVSATLTPLADNARSAVSSQLTQIYKPSFAVQEAANYAYSSEASRVQGRLENLNQQYDQARDASLDPVQQHAYDALARPDILAQEGESEKDAAGQWHKAIVFMSPDPDRKRTVVHSNTARVYLLHDFQGIQLIDAKLSVMMMGYLRGVEEPGPDQQVDIDAQMFDIYKDIAVTTASLSRPAWTAEATLGRIRSAAWSRSMTERYVDLRQNTQRQIDRVPVSRLGIRTESAVLKDKLIGAGGVWVPRQSLGYAYTN
ncbi:hypothetical protein LTS07_009499 [Exophiala sideris]|uniref:Riboflavin kinase n=1 Tax=Exophiala sideris TaxID=1016849 RepID=A0ABR0J0I3_9EURO|nr:hypothetical protein LTS07_009499 [Exophiala sideris]KAK5028648.1 hypothetical protein LTR13_009100 [Exophiala sideris]KAK5053026.1 hypothetical protein LTR69_009596 [Exophiala sideris]KAK5178766.1 hypothetical protein LTR44_008881 [Eurotiomycetes sp. CCFEE 6388]